MIGSLDEDPVRERELAESLIRTGRHTPESFRQCPPAAGASGPVQLIDGYRDADELLSQDGVRNGLIRTAPFELVEATTTADGAILR